MPVDVESVEAQTNNEAIVEVEGPIVIITEGGELSPNATGIELGNLRTLCCLK